MPLDKSKIQAFGTPHSKDGSGGGTTIIMGGAGKDVKIPSDINVTSINASQGDITEISGNSLKYNYGEIATLNSVNGNINALVGNQASFDYANLAEISSTRIGTQALTANDIQAITAYIQGMTSDSITTNRLDVTGQAHFFELIIDKINSVGGQLILSPASCIADYVEAGPSNQYYDIYFRATDPYNRTIKNDWKVNDQAICQSFNNASQGVNIDVENKYYWRLVKAILNDQYMNVNTGAKLTGTIGQQASKAKYNEVRIINMLRKTGGSSILGGNQPWLYYYDDNSGNDVDFYFKNENNAYVDWDITPHGDSTFLEDTQITLCDLMRTRNTSDGVEFVVPSGVVNNYALSKFVFPVCDGRPIGGTPTQNTPCRLAFTFLFTDGSTQYFKAPTTPTTTYEFNLNSDSSLVKFYVTNADEVEWKLVHGIRLGNQAGEYYNINSGWQGYQGFQSIPSAGDNIVQLGYRGNDDINRQSAIIIASYNTPDVGIQAPSYAQYQEINDFNLSSHRKSYIDARGARFVGDLRLTDGTSMQDYVTASSNEIRTEIANNWAGDMYTKFEEVIDLTSLLEDRFYPVGIKIDARPIGTRIIIDRGFDASWGAPNYGTHTVYDEETQEIINNGFIFLLDWHTVGSGWGTNWPAGAQASGFTPQEANGTGLDTYRFINEYNVQWTQDVTVTPAPEADPYTIPANYIGGSISQNSHTDEELLYLRGGSKYRIRTDNEVTDVTVYQNGYTYTYTNAGHPDLNRSISMPILTDINNIVIPEIDTTHRSEIIQTAYGIQANVYNGLLQTGINIGQQTIELRGDKVTFTSANGQQSGKIYIDPTTGTLHATDADLAGTLTSENEGMMNKIEINGPQGYIRMLGPDSVEDGTVLPATGAQQVDLFSIEYMTNGDVLRRYTNLAMYSDDKIIQLNPLDGLYIYDDDYGLIIGKRYIQYIDGNDIYLRYYEDLLTNTVDVKAISNTTHTATKGDSLLVFTGSNTARTLTLPDPEEMQGKVMYIKNINGSSLRVTCSVNNSIMTQNSSSTTNYVDIGKNSAMFISTGGYWIRFV